MFHVKQREQYKKNTLFHMEQKVELTTISKYKIYKVKICSTWNSINAKISKVFHVEQIVII